MLTITETTERLQVLLGNSLSALSSGFMEVSALVKSPDHVADLPQKIDALFHRVLKASRSISEEVRALIEHQEKIEQQMKQLTEEKHRLEVLYASGILFSSETEMKALMEKAIDTVMRELQADAGFIVLVNEAGETESVFTRNVDMKEEPEACEMSKTVIRTTIAQSQPTQLNDEADDSFVRKQSVIRLGITAALCVPLIAKEKTFGAVYLDRRHQARPFTEADLVFLLSFAKQIVRGMEVSLEISTLEKRLVSDASMKFEDLRKDFKCEQLIGSSRKLFDVLKLASQIAPTDASVVLLGENGTGKDLLASAMHQNSRRAGKPFVTIHCGAIPVDLLESELFGYECGAFTGATKMKPGKLELADHGTVFLDEIGEMPVNLQAKLLRVIQTKEFERLGSVRTKKIDVRILAATNRDIKEMIAAGTFREDLYYRLKVFELVLPPLRERREDILELANYFIAKYSQPDQSFSLSEEALNILEGYCWHGNVRELENVMQRAVVLAKSSVIEASNLPNELSAASDDALPVPIGTALLDAETEFRRWFIVKTLRKAKTNAEAAQILGINRTHFYKLLAQLDIQS